MGSTPEKGYTSPRTPAIFAGLRNQQQWRPRGIADLVRLVVEQRRAISEPALISWCDDTLSTIHTSAGNVQPLIRAIIDALVAVGDIGRSRCFGETVLVAVAWFSVELPKFGYALLGDWATEAEPEAGHTRLVRITDRTSPEIRSNAVTLTQYLGSPTPEAVNHIKHNFYAPIQGVGPSLERIAGIFGNLDALENKILLDEANRGLIHAWADLPEVQTPSSSARILTPAQLEISSAPMDARQLIEAGPGSGKTFTACRRVAHLLEQESTQPERILILSFTRVAVAELRDRIANALPDPSNAMRIRIATFDSFAARLIKKASDEATNFGHEASIRRAIKLLRKNPIIRDFVYDLDHIIIDEAQDLVGDRCDFCNELISQIHDDCGATVFGDSAQAIYNHGISEAPTETLMELLSHDNDFIPVNLLENHRTQSRHLRNLFQDARRELIEQANTEAGNQLWASTKQRIEKAAVETGIADVVARPDLTDHVMLMRTRAEVHTLAARFREEGKPCRIRLSGRPKRIDPWIAAAIGDLPTMERVNREDIALNIARIVENVPEDIVEQTWKRLLQLSPEKSDQIHVGEVAAELHAGAPLELLLDHEGASGPLLSTIHAWKGREAAKVIILQRPSLRENSDPLEEARILFVGATRATNELRTARAIFPNYLRPLQGERRWRATQTFQEVEIGLDGDVPTPDAVLQRPLERGRSQELWQAATRNAAAIAVRSGRTWNIYTDRGDNTPEGQPLGEISATFTEALTLLPGISSIDELPSVLTNFRIVGATTSVTRKSEGGKRQISLQPMLGGLARLYRSAKQDGC